MGSCWPIARRNMDTRCPQVPQIVLLPSPNVALACKVSATCCICRCSFLLCVVVVVVLVAAAVVFAALLSVGGGAKIVASRAFVRVYMLIPRGELTAGGGVRPSHRSVRLYT